MPKPCEFCNAPDTLAVLVAGDWIQTCPDCEPDFKSLSEFSIFVGDILDAFDYLDELRKSGRTNMFDGANFLLKEWAPDYEITSKELCTRILQFWMHSFERRAQYSAPNSV